MQFTCGRQDGMDGNTGRPRNGTEKVVGLGKSVQEAKRPGRPQHR